jgi:hypothetical protein
MAIRGKGLFSDSMIEISHSFMKRFSQDSSAIGNGMSSSVYSLGIFQDGFGLSFFDSEIRKKIFAKINKIVSMNSQNVTLSSIRQKFCGKYSSMKKLLHFFKDFFVSVGNRKAIYIKSIFSSVIRSGSKNAYIKATFTVNKTSTISEKFFIHNIQHSIPKNKCLAATKQAKGRSSNGMMRCSELMGNHERTAEKIVPLSYNKDNKYFFNVIKSYKSNRLTYSVITKEVTLQNQDPVLNQAAARLGQSMRETEDQLIRDMLEATASLINCVGGTNGDNPTEIVRSDVDGVVAALQNNDGEFISEMIGGEDKFGTGPVRDSYFAMANSNMIGQLENVQGFIAKAQYPRRNIGVVKFLVIDMEAQEGDMAQAKAA